MPDHQQSTGDGPGPVEPVKVRCVSHVGITVSDIDRSLAFYQTVLGFRLLSDMRLGGSPRASLALGDVSLELFDQPADEVTFVPEPTTFGRPKLALTVEDLRQAHAALDALGVEVWGQFDTPASSLLWIRDPDGTPIQLHQFMSGAKNVVEFIADSEGHRSSQGPTPSRTLTHGAAAPTDEPVAGHAGVDGERRVPGRAG